MSKYPNAYYRVSVKAVIRDDAGRVLLVKEGDCPFWSLPGGGVDHGENLDVALQRELYEELALEAVESAEFLGTHMLYSEKHEAWFMWLMHDVKVGNYKPVVGEHATEAAFVDLEMIRDSSEHHKNVYNAVAPLLATRAFVQIT